MSVPTAKLTEAGPHVAVMAELVPLCVATAASRLAMVICDTGGTAVVVVVAGGVVVVVVVKVWILHFVPFHLSASDVMVPL
jgi:hypothetical protein